MKNLYSRCNKYFLYYVLRSECSEPDSRRVLRAESSALIARSSLGLQVLRAESSALIARSPLGLQVLPELCSADSRRVLRAESSALIAQSPLGLQVLQIKNITVGRLNLWYLDSRCISWYFDTHII